MRSRAPAVPQLTIGASLKDNAASSSGWSREWVYFAIVMVTWSFTPFFRRLLDWRNGAYNPVQVISLIPFLMILPFAIICCRSNRINRLAPVFRLFVKVWIATFAYAFLVAAVLGTLTAGTYELVEYLVPMIMGIWIAGQDLSIEETVQRLGIIILTCACIVAIYGLFQWAQPMPWDSMWVEGSGLISSIGPPVPFTMRIFSTLNAPGPAADFLALAILISLPLIRVRAMWTLPLLALISSALLLTLVREAWIALLIGVALYLVFSPRRWNVIPWIVVLGTLIVFLASSLPAMLGETQGSDIISTRISSLGNISDDQSAQTRQAEISDALAQGLDNPIGLGLGVIGAASKLGANPQESFGNVLDSGYLARFTELGWLGFVGYIFVTIGGPIAIIFGMRKNASAISNVKVVGAVSIALCGALAWIDAATDAHLGLGGLFFWIALAMGSLVLQTVRTSKATLGTPFARGIAKMESKV